MKTVTSQILFVFLLALGLFPSQSQAGYWYIDVIGQSGMTAVSCYHGTIEHATGLARNQASRECVRMYNGALDGREEIQSQRCGRESSAVATCPHVCTVRIRFYCQN